MDVRETLFPSTPRVNPHLELLPWAAQAEQETFPAGYGVSWEAVGAHLDPWEVTAPPPAAAGEVLGQDRLLSWGQGPEHHPVGCCFPAKQGVWSGMEIMWNAQPKYMDLGQVGQKHLGHRWLWAEGLPQMVPTIPGTPLSWQKCQPVIQTSMSH